MKKISKQIILIILGCVLLSSVIIPLVALVQPIQRVTVDSTWTSLVENRKAAIAQLPAYDTFPENATSWADYAENSFEELLRFDDCWIYEGDVMSFRPYVKGADAWGGPDYTRQNTELIAAMDVLWPMYRYLQLHPNSSRQAMVDNFIIELPEYYADPFKQTINNPYSGQGDYRHDSWYYAENSLLKYGHLYLISNISVLENPYFGSLESGVEMAHNLDYLFPQFVSMLTKKQTFNTNINYGTAGLLAYSLITAYELTENLTYLTEAEQALTAMRDVSKPYNLAYEPQELAAGAAAASKMLQYTDLLDSTTNFAQLAQDLFYVEEQTIYYDGGQIDWSFGFNPDPSLWLPPTWRDGMHSPYSNPKELGTGGINAPAYKENFEAIMFWADYLKHIYLKPGFYAEEPLKILNLNRIKNFYFFSPNIPDQYERSYGPVTLQYIPYEDIDYHDLRNWELESDRYKAGYNGKEIYGAGETFWAYLLFEALGEAADPNVLIVNLNIFDQSYPPSPEERGFIAFNPYNEQKDLTFTLKELNDSYSVYSNGTLLAELQPLESFNLTLPARGSAYLTINTPNLVSYSFPKTTTPRETSNQGRDLPIYIFLIGSSGFLGLILIYAIFYRKQLD